MHIRPVSAVRCALPLHNRGYCTAVALGAHVQRTAREPFAPEMNCCASKLLQPANFAHRNALLAQKLRAGHIAVPKNCRNMHLTGTAKCAVGHVDLCTDV